ncbi:MAG: trypsin-like peptidase domain-containing protein [Syntrophomonas sp.]
MNKRVIQGGIYFLFFFSLGLAIFTWANSGMAPSKPMVREEKGVVLTNSVSDVAKRVSPSIVGITNLSHSGDMFNQRDTEVTGSGVIIDKTGYIVTNNHVVKGAERLIVTLADGQELKGTIKGTDQRTDLAVIKIEPKTTISPAQFGNSDKLVVGEDVIAIGNPLGLRFARSVTAGVISGLNRLITTEEGFVFRLIQTDAAINPGNSGGALVNLNGKVIGINTIKISVAGFEGMGFSIPSNQVQTVVDNIIKHGKVLRPLMGIRILGEVSQNEARYYNFPVKYGVVVEPQAGGPADRAGLKKYDIITSINGNKVETGQELQEQIFARKIGQRIKVDLVRAAVREGEKPKQLKINVELVQE